MLSHVYFHASRSFGSDQTRLPVSHGPPLSPAAAATRRPGLRDAPAAAQHRHHDHGRPSRPGGLPGGVPTAAAAAAGRAAEPPQHALRHARHHHSAHRRVHDGGGHAGRDQGLLSPAVRDHLQRRHRRAGGVRRDRGAAAGQRQGPRGAVPLLPAMVHGRDRGPGARGAAAPGAAGAQHVPAPPGRRRGRTGWRAAHERTAGSNLSGAGEGADGKDGERGWGSELGGGVGAKLNLNRTEKGGNV